MKYVKTVEANIWDADNEAQVDKIVDWLTINAPGLFDLEDNELRIQTEFGVRDVHQGDAIIIDPEKNRPVVMTGRAFLTIHEMLSEI